MSSQDEHREALSNMGRRKLIITDEFIQEAVDSWAEYQETGLHITGEEMSAWLKTWGTDQYTDPPKCHT